jgi:hypothetical protein
MSHGAVPNGDPTATRVNQWTLIVDVLMDDTNRWFSFIQTDLTGDGDLFKNPGGGIGISGNYQGSMVSRQWHRVAFALDMIGTAPVISKFIDGVKVADQARTAPQLDARHSLRPTAFLFQDEDGESQLAYINSIQFRNYKMGDQEIAALGGADAEGIPLVSGQWDFNNGGAVFAEGLKSTIGRDLQYFPGTDFNTIYQSVPLGSGTADVLSYTAGTDTDGYLVPHGGLPNGGGQRVNQYSLIMDVYYPASSTGFRALWQTDTNFPAANDAELFVNGNNGIGISQYHGRVAPDEWPARKVYQWHQRIDRPGGQCAAGHRTVPIPERQLRNRGRALVPVASGFALGGRGRRGRAGAHQQRAVSASDAHGG